MFRHIFCHKDLYAWFHRLPIDYDSELEFELPDSDFDDDNDRNDRRRSGHNNNHHNEQILEAGPPGSDFIINSLPLPPPPRPTPYRRKRNLICPQCRTSVHSKPFQLYAIKEATDHLRKFESNNHKNKLESIEALSSSPKHRLIKGKYDPENHRDEKDSSWGNLFNDDERSFNQSSRRNNNVVRDFEDGVRRCIRCAWEISADGICEGCGEIYSDVEDSISGQSDSSDNRWEEEREQNEEDESFDHDRYSNEEDAGDSEGRYENDDESSDEYLPISNRRIGIHRSRVDDSDEGCNDSDIETERNHESGDDPDDDDPDDQTERYYQGSRSSDDTDENEVNMLHHHHDVVGLVIGGIQK
ncbi:hypothetical protein CROQUDRAFT_168479 [Cronartium quercuum f. sp. fusiforme G11]|uniref:Uncharacterized protein n=1 Tax=Cronartium quercuum f. sp. fusiforme G11 TaxID=708437 RepID=A0A9P6TAK6_9BASI|nr:hypothetical protein CROQUDRAFT_168479 [Cronartium quercuum f. sp. fusiforme G11]